MKEYMKELFREEWPMMVLGFITGIVTALLW